MKFEFHRIFIFYFFIKTKIVDEDNPALEPIINAMNTVRDPGKA